MVGFGIAGHEFDGWQIFANAVMCLHVSADGPVWIVGPDDEAIRWLSPQAHPPDYQLALPSQVGLFAQIALHAQSYRQLPRQGTIWRNVDDAIPCLKLWRTVVKFSDNSLPAFDLGEKQLVGIGVGTDCLDPHDFNND
jgi:hypothetical protein